MFKLRPEHTAAFRKQAYRRTLAQSFRRSGLEADAEDPSTEDLLVRDPKGRQARVTFDSQGFISGTESPSGRSWQLENDSKGRMLGFTNSAGLHSTFERNSQGQVTNLSQGGRSLMGLEYDPKGLLTQVSYPDRTARSLSYDPAGRITTMGDRRGNTEGFEYDFEGLLTAITDGNGNRTQFQYGGWDRPEKTLYADGSSESYRYNPAGLPEQILSGSEFFAAIEYNPQGRPAKITYSDDEEVTFTYNEKGSIVEAKNPEIEIGYQYDEQNRVVLEKQGDDIVQYFYDQAGSLVGMTYPTGERIEFSYDEDLRLAAVKDWNGGLQRYSYGSDDLSLQVSLPGGLKKLISSEVTGLPSSIVVTHGPSSGGELFSFKYDYDAENRVRRFSDSQFGPRDYIYDPESQLTEVRSERPEFNEAFTYDRAGNRIRANGAGGIFNTLNQLMRQGGSPCRYDARGNLAALSSAGGEWHYHYNGRNFLVLAEGPEGQSVTFGYDAFGRRLWKHSTNSEVQYIWAGERLLREVTHIGSRTSIRDYLYFPGSCVPLATRLDGHVYLYHTDRLGTPRRLTDENGAVVWSADYAAFGETHIQVEAISNALRFPGQYFDQETGLHYNRFRYYSTSFGRYISRDPISFLSGPNFYTYAHNDPINSFDTLGLSFWSTVLTIAGAIVAAIVVAELVTVLAPVLVAAGLGVEAAAGVTGIASTLLSGTAAVAAGFGLNEGLTNGWNFSCVWEKVKRGAKIGASASLAFIFLPAGILADAAAGALAYEANWATDPDPNAKWNLDDFEEWVALSITLGFLLRPFVPKQATRLGSQVATETEEAAKQTTVLGHGPAYTELGNKIGANYLDIPPEEWGAMSASEKWATNQKFLDDMIARGDNVVLATKASTAEPGSFYAKELEYLAGKGYRVSDDGMSLIAPER